MNKKCVVFDFKSTTDLCLSIIRKDRVLTGEALHNQFAVITWLKTGIVVRFFESLKYCQYILSPALHEFFKLHQTVPRLAVNFKTVQTSKFWSQFNYFSRVFYRHLRW